MSHLKLALNCVYLRVRLARLRASNMHPSSDVLPYGGLSATLFRTCCVSQNWFWNEWPDVYNMKCVAILQYVTLLSLSITCGLWNSKLNLQTRFSLSLIECSAVYLSFRLIPNTVHTPTQCSAVVGSWEEPPNIWLTSAFVGWASNFWPRPHVSGYFRICNFFFPDSKISPSTRSVFKSNSPVHTYPMVSGFTLVLRAPLH